MRTHKSYKKITEYAGKSNLPLTGQITFLGIINMIKELLDY